MSESGDFSPVQPQVGVTPVTELAFAEKLVSDVESSDESDLAVHDNDFAVFAEVDEGVEERNFEQEEDLHPSAGFPEVFEELTFHLLDSYGVEEYPYFYPS